MHSVKFFIIIHETFTVCNGGNYIVNVIRKCYLRGGFTGFEGGRKEVGLKTSTKNVFFKIKWSIDKCKDLHLFMVDVKFQ